MKVRFENVLTVADLREALEQFDGSCQFKLVSRCGDTYDVPEGGRGAGRYAVIEGHCTPGGGPPNENSTH